MAITFTVKGANDLYLDLNNSRLHVLAKITQTEGTNINANRAGPINLTLHSIFQEICLELNGRNVSDTSQLYPYRSHMETLLNFCKTNKQTRLLCEGCTNDTTWHMCVTAVGGNNAGLNARAATFAKSTVVELIVRPHLEVINQELLIIPNIYLHIKLMPSLNNLCASWQRQVKVLSRKITSCLSRASILSSGPRSLPARLMAYLWISSYCKTCGIIYRAFK